MDTKSLTGSLFFPRKWLQKLSKGQRIVISYYGLLLGELAWKRIAVINEIENEQWLNVEIIYKNDDDEFDEDQQKDFSESCYWLDETQQYEFYITFEPNDCVFQRQETGLAKLVEMYKEDPDSEILTEIIGKYGEKSKNAVDVGVSEFTEYDPKIEYSWLTEKQSGGVLNNSQNMAVWHASTQPLTLIQGPPGTGKTTTSANIILTWLLDSDIKLKSKILVCAPSNTATTNLAVKLDDICKRMPLSSRPTLVRIMARTQEHVKMPNMEFCLHVQAHKHLMKTSETYRNLLQKEKLQKYLKAEDTVTLIKIKYATERKILLNADIICSTCSSTEDYRITGKMGHLKIDDDPLKFTHLLIDEATQSVESDTILPIVMTSQKVVMVGD